MKLSEYINYLLVASRVLFLFGIFYFSTLNFTIEENGNFDYQLSIISMISVLFTFSFEKLVLNKFFFNDRNKLCGILNSLHLYSFVFSSFFIFFFWFDNFSFLLSVVVLILTTSFNQFYFSLFLREDRIILSNLLRSILLALNLILVYFRIFEDLKLLQVVLISQLSVSIIIFLIYGRFYFYPLRLSLAFLKNNFRMISLWYSSVGFDSVFVALFFWLVTVYNS